MATEAQIRIVAEMLGPSATDNGWDDTRISADIDNGLTANQIALAWWRYRAAQTAQFVNVSEGGSSRSLSDIHRAAAAMASQFEKSVSQDEQGDPQDKPISYRSRTISRA